MTKTTCNVPDCQEERQVSRTGKAYPRCANHQRTYERTRHNRNPLPVCACGQPVYRRGKRQETQCAACLHKVIQNRVPMYNRIEERVALVESDPKMTIVSIDPLLGVANFFYVCHARQVKLDDLQTPARIRQFYASRALAVIEV